MTRQLTFGGGEETPVEVSGRTAGFTACQRAILQQMAGGRTIRSIEAGVIVHRHRPGGCRRCQGGSCPYTGSDGTDAMKRLMARGLVERVSPGVWRIAVKTGASK